MSTFCQYLFNRWQLFSYKFSFGLIPLVKIFSETLNISLLISVLILNISFMHTYGNAVYSQKKFCVQLALIFCKSIKY